jgi:Ca2+-binding EF-hand superfamily protein
MNRSLALAIGLLLSVGAVAAETATTDAAPRAHRWLTDADSNADGKVTLDEFLAAQQRRFAVLDTQHRGSLDAVDFAAAPGSTKFFNRMAQGVLKHEDKDGDGKLSAAEASAAADARFARLDRNNDGVLSAEELAAGGFRGRHGGGGDDKRAAHAQDRLAKLDTNKDGVVSRDEFVADANARFAQADSNHDGLVDASEIVNSPRALDREAHFAQRQMHWMDSNGDGLVSEQEFLDAAKKRFARMDRDGDGVLTAADRQGRRMARDRAAQDDSKNN